MRGKTIFLGTKDLGLEILKALRDISRESLSLVVSYDDSSDPRSCLKKYKDYCAKTGLPLEIIPKPSAVNEIIKKEKPDLCIVSGWYWLIADDVLDIPRIGIVGVHGSLLPSYRGNAPLVWAMINGDKETGITLFYFDRSMDAGDIIAQKKIKILNSDTISEVLAKAERASVEMIRDNYLKILNGTAPRRKQNEEQASYVSRRTPEDGKIDWAKGSIDVYNFIRAQSQPYPGAFSVKSDDRRLYILKARIYPKNFLGIPGLVAGFEKNAAIVCCGRGAILADEIRLDGGRIVKPNKVLKYGDKLL